LGISGALCGNCEQAGKIAVRFRHPRTLQAAAGITGAPMPAAQGARDRGFGIATQASARWLPAVKLSARTGQASSAMAPNGEIRFTQAATAAKLALTRHRV
jgi:hypothetical protein